MFIFDEENLKLMLGPGVYLFHSKYFVEPVYIGVTTRGLVRPLADAQHRQKRQAGYSLEFIPCITWRKAFSLETVLIYLLTPRENKEVKERTVERCFDSIEIEMKAFLCTHTLSDYAKAKLEYLESLSAPKK